jgi:hypothetical protein
MSLHSVTPPEDVRLHHSASSSEAVYMRGLIDGMERARLEAEAQQPPPSGTGRLITPTWWLAFMAGLVTVLVIAATALVLTRLDQAAERHDDMLELARTICLTDVEISRRQA